MKFFRYSLFIFLIFTTFLFAENTDTCANESPVGTIPFTITWKIDNPGTSGSNKITIPTFSGIYNYNVNGVMVQPQQEKRAMLRTLIRLQKLIL